MEKIIFTTTSTAYLSLLSFNASASNPVPEMDGGSAMIALGLAVGVVVLLREHRNKK